MHKQGAVTSTADWEHQRALRNAAGHSYADLDAIAEILNGIYAGTPKVLGIVQCLAVASASLAGDGEVA
jgi:hypothetical protein